MAEGKFDLPEDLFPSKPGVEPWRLKADVPRGNFVDKELMGLQDDSKDSLISDNIPLTPQWLYAKTSESKTSHVPLSGETRAQQNPSHDPAHKDGWRLEGTQEKKDWRRPVPEMDISRRWREEERDTVLLSRRERKKEGERETDYRKTSAPPREPDTRSAPLSEKWYEGSTRNSGHENRRDSKWSSRWGPEDKEEPRAEKKTAVEKDKDDTQSEKQAVAGDKWRPRHRQDVQLGSSAAYRAAPGFGLEKGRTDGQPLGFSAGRGRASPNGNFQPSSASPIGFTKEDGLKKEAFRYPRGKLLDIYRKQSFLLTSDALPDGIEEIPSLTQSKRILPLAFVTPDEEEKAVVNDMWAGKIISSDMSSDHLVREKMSKFQDIESDEQGNSDSFLTTNILATDAALSYIENEITTESYSGLNFHMKTALPTNQEPIYASIAGPKVINLESASLPGIPPANDQSITPLEEMSFLYRDPQGEVQGPFLGVDIMSWFDQGFFGTDLPVRQLDAPEGTPFKALGEIMPHLKLKGSSPSQVAHSEPSDLIGGNPHDALESSVSNGQRIPLHSDRIDLQDHSFSRSRPDSAPDAEAEVIYRGRPAANSQNRPSASPAFMEDASLHPLGSFLSELEAHQKRPLSTNLSGISNAGLRPDLHDTWPNAIGRQSNINHNPNPNLMAAPQMPSFDQDSGRVSLEHQMLLQQIQLQHLQQQDQHQRHPLDQLHNPHHSRQLVNPHPSEIDNLLKLQFQQQQQQQLLHLQQKQQQQKEQMLLEQLLQRQMQESSFMSPQAIQEELYQERLHHHLKQQSLQRQRQMDPVMEQLLHSRFMHRQQHNPEEEEILEALQAKHNQSLLEQQQLILRLQQEQQLQQLQEERHHLARTGLGRHWAQMDRLAQGAHQNRVPLAMQQAMFEPSLHDQFTSNLNAVRPNQFNQMPELDGPFQMRLDGERMRRNFRGNPGPEDPSLWAVPGNDEKSARLLMGLLGSREMVNIARDVSSQGIRDSSWAFTGPSADSYNTIPGGQSSSIESGNRFQYPSIPGELLEDSGVDFFDVKDGAKNMKSWPNVKSAPQVAGGNMGFYNMEMNSDGDPNGELMNADRLLMHRRQGSLPSQDPPTQFTENIMEGGISGSTDIRRSPSEASFVDMLMTAKKPTSAEAEVSAVPFDADSAAAAAAAAARASSKKKGKKGRQIDPSLLGFKVHSNRIMMGEIHRPEDL